MSRTSSLVFCARDEVFSQLYRNIMSIKKKGSSLHYCMDSAVLITVTIENMKCLSITVRIRCYCAASQWSHNVFDCYIFSVKFSLLHFSNCYFTNTMYSSNVCIPFLWSGFVLKHCTSIYVGSHRSSTPTCCVKSVLKCMNSFIRSKHTAEGR